MYKIFPNLIKTINPQIQKLKELKHKKTLKKITPRPNIFKLFITLIQRKIFKAAGEKRHIAYKGTRMRMTVDVSLETMQTKR